MFLNSFMPRAIKIIRKLYGDVMCMANKNIVVMGSNINLDFL
jgi:hypothetical protein